MASSDRSSLEFESHPSPNFDERPDGVAVDTIVIHATALASLDQVIRHFADPVSKVSSHYTIDKNGTIVCHVSEDKRAWHAGQSKMKDGRTEVNDFSVGIELVNLNDGFDPFPEFQIESLRALIKSVLIRHSIKNIVAHYECADPPGRKSDPVGFDRTWFNDLLEPYCGRS